MEYSRKVFIKNFAGLAAMGTVAPTVITESFSANKIRALAFDAFPIFDPRSVFHLVECLFTDKGRELNNLWRTRQFEYQWLRSLSGAYQDFWTVTQDALIFAANSLNVDLTDGKRVEIMNAYLNLKI